jgi:hypothetical protein
MQALARGAHPFAARGLLARLVLLALAALLLLLVLVTAALLLLRAVLACAAAAARAVDGAEVLPQQLRKGKPQRA